MPDSNIKLPARQEQALRQIQILTQSTGSPPSQRALAAALATGTKSAKTNPQHLIRPLVAKGLLFPPKPRVKGLYLTQEALAWLKADAAAAASLRLPQT